MAQNADTCAICGDSKSTRWITVQARRIPLCADHAAIVRAHKPRTFEQLRDLFRPRCGITTLADRRSALPRRDPVEPDRRMFQRPEGRRHDDGRRITDQMDPPIPPA